MLFKNNLLVVIACLCIIVVLGVSGYNTVAKAAILALAIYLFISRRQEKYRTS